MTKQSPVIFIMSWIICTLIGATLQTFRNLEQKYLNKKIDTLTVSWSRFILPLPFALIVVFLTLNSASKEFVFYCIVTATFQIAGNFFLLRTIQSKNFSIGVAFYKTEVLQTMIIGLLFFHQQISLTGFAAIMVTVMGVILMSNFTLKNASKVFDQAAIFGLLSGLSFSISAFNLKFASEVMMLDGYSVIKAPLITLFWVIVFQNIIFFIIKSSQKRFISDLKTLFSAENKFVFLKMGLLSFSGSAFWFVAFTLGNVIYVKAVGQIEMVLAVLISHVHLKEQHKRRDIAGLILTSIGILALIFFH